MADRRPSKGENKIIKQDRKGIRNRFGDCPSCEGEGTINGHTCIACRGLKKRSS